MKERIKNLERELNKKWNTSLTIGLLSGFAIGVLFMLILKIVTKL